MAGDDRDGDGLALAMPGQAMRFGILGGDADLRAAVDDIPGLTVARHADPDADAQWRRVINPAEIDALIVAAAPAWRAAVIQDALAVGVPVLCRGVLATASADVGLMRRLAAMGGGLVMGWHPWLFDPAHAAMREIGGMIGPLRAIRAEVAVPDALDPADLLWRHADETVAAALELLGGRPDHCSAETEAGGGVLLRLVYKSEATVHLRLLPGAARTARRFTLHHDPVVLDWRQGGGLSLHPPVRGFGMPDGPGEPIADVAADGGPAQAVRTFAHMVLEREAQPQLLDFAADVVTVIEQAVASLEP